MTLVAEPPEHHQYELADRFRTGSDPVLLTGVQAVARLLVEQHARDERAGLRTASFVSGYPGSPLAGLDKMLDSVPELRTEHDVHLVPALNEELGATAVWGSQLELPKGARSRDGVLGVWYGKGPGLDRSGDAIRHGNLYGAHARGGALVLTGDDPASKSSTVPCASEKTLAAMGLPVLFPRTSEDLITLGLYGAALSRASGCWVGIKIVSDVADGLWTVERDFAALDIVVPTVEWEGRPWTYQQRILMAPSDSLIAEADLFGPRWELVKAFGAANPLDVIEVNPASAWLGIAAAGTAYDLARQALRDLGLDDAALARAGIRLLRIGMPYPLGRERLEQFAHGLTDLLVVEEKTEFVETQVRDLLYGRVSTPRVLGKRDAVGHPLVPATGALTADRLVGAFRTLLGDRMELAPAKPPVRTLLSLTAVSRIPYFCSGCPHNRSTVVPEGSLAAGGIGCHTMVTLAPRESAQVTGLTQMGGEGVQWVGQAPFTDVGHIFQNMGDGTYFHSGQLAVQACIAAGVNITFKILYNAAVAMTGAQDPQGALDVPTLTRKLQAEGVRKIVVCADEPKHYGRRAQFAPGTAVWDRDRLEEAQLLLRDTPGVTVIIFDQRCAAEAHRLRKRGRLPERTKRVIVNEAVCEGCGDCGVKSNCLSVQPVETDFGRKTHIDQTTCNTDYSCLDGDCPSFVTVEVPTGRAKAASRRPEAPKVAEPDLPAVGESYDIFLAGIGGTGIVTVNQILATAALVDGLRSAGLDQTGLSQKAGPVTSHLRLSRQAGEPANKLSAAGADCYLAFDLMVGTEAKDLAFLDRDRSIAIASTSRTPTGEMVFDGSVRYPEETEMLQRLSGQAAHTVHLDALAAADALFDSTAVANLLVVGAAFQAGALPLTASAIESAIELNAVAVDVNIAAFRWGRAAVADPTAFAVATRQAAVSEALLRDLPADSPLDGAIRDVAKIRFGALIAHSGEGAARRYLDVVHTAWRAEQGIGAGDYTQAVARGLHRFMAYKDEYEVARLLTDPVQEAAVRAQLPAGSRVTYNLHPPTLRAAGVGHKIALGPAWRPVLRTLAKGRVLRGTPLDPFGMTRVRRLERALVDDYVELLGRLSATLSAATARPARPPDQ
jgi:indolepyruvate ferredoxin oxidoreductase